jgi:DNA-binding PadR family transcriptional regulator
MTNAELAVLSLVVECPRHGYDIERVIAERGMRDWTDVGFSSIYYLLGKMEKAGLVEAHEDVDAGTGPARRVYAPTEEGLVAWTEASLEALATSRVEMPFLLGLSGLGGLPIDRALAAARECLRTLDERLAVVRERHVAARDVGAPWFVEETFDYSEHSLAAAREWVDAFVGRLEKRMGRA